MDVHVTCPNPVCGKRLRTSGEMGGRRVFCPHCKEPFTPTTPGNVLSTPHADGITPAPPGAPRPAGTPALAAVGRFQIPRQLGAGGFGTVYRAYDPQLDREVALKIPLPGTLDEPHQVQRFLREARAAAGLRHPHIVPIFEAGGQPPQCYIASAYVEGRTLAVACAEGSLAIAEAARLVQSLAEALAYAHSQGVVHRDVKPANVQLDTRGAAHLLDFGLAYRREAAEKLTQEGVLPGTPAYMAPERVTEPDKKPAPASDQYSLGVMLYELLCGRTPFDGPPEVVLFNVIHSEPARPRQINADIPRDLETVCCKAMSKRPQDRYADCQALADDLRRWREGEPIHARRVGVLERAGKWCRKNPLSAVLIGAVAASLVLGTAIAWAFAARAEQNERTALQALEDVKTEKKKADSELLRAEWLVYAGKISLAHRELEGNEVHDARDLLDSCRWDFRGWEHDYLYTLGHSNPYTLRDQHTLRGHTSGVTSVAFSPDGQRLASGSSDKTVKLWVAHRGQEVLTLKGHTLDVTSVAFSADGKRLASASDDGTVKVWDAQSGQEVLTLRGHITFVNSVAFGPDGKRLASASRDQTVKVWDAESGKEVLTLKGHTNVVGSVTFSPDGQRLASASWDQTVKVWEAESGKEVLTLRGHTSGVTSVAFSPDGQRLASGSHDQTVKVWDAQSGQEFLTFKGHTSSVMSVGFSPNGKRLASASNKTVKVWVAESGQEILTLRGHTHGVNSVAFSPDGKRLASGSHDQTVKVWDGTTKAPRHPATP